MTTEIQIGTGVLGWERHERVTDRYGSVCLMNGTTWTAKGKNLRINEKRIGQRGQLIAEVLETRQSTHLGDWFHGIGPSTPGLGERIVLGEGTLFTQYGKDVEGTCVGVKPLDGRREFWLSPKALYRANNQTVRLLFAPVD